MKTYKAYFRNKQGMLETTLVNASCKTDAEMALERKGIFNYSGLHLVKARCMPIKRQNNKLVWNK